MLLADFHIHTTWSDGKLPMPEVIDLFGRSGHDVIAITDHIVNTDSLIGKVTGRFGLTLTEKTFDAYLAELERERRRAWDEYNMLVLSGCELTQNAMTRRNSAHVLAIGIDRFISANGTVQDMLVRARASASLVVACHPNEMSDWYANTFYLWNRRQEVGALIDLWEVACRWDVFQQVSRARMPFIGNSDFHQEAHLYAWKTLVPSEKNEQAVLRSLKHGQGLALTRLTTQAPWRAPMTAAFAASAG
ncbi:MAG TPA: PHP domain-containing protein [Thermoanaerobaculia bacterium]|nr:PHP domain-containing protein [Thermoanaerobaculia bacterium]